MIKIYMRETFAKEKGALPLVFKAKYLNESNGALVVDFIGKRIAVSWTNILFVVWP